MQSGKSFSRNLKKLRHMKGLSQKDLADMLFVTRKCVGNWEVGIRKPDLEMLEKISNALNVSVSDLVDTTNKKSHIYPQNLTGFNTTSQVFDTGSFILVESDSVLKDKYSSMISNIIDSDKMDSFNSAVDFYNYALNQKVSTAFIDTDLSDENAFILAQKLIGLNPRANIIIITDNPDDALPAMDIFCSGIILKPVTTEKIINQLEHLRFPIAQ